MVFEEGRATARIAFELLKCLENPPYDIRPLTVAAMNVDISWGFFIEPFVLRLLEGDEQVWAKMLGHFRGRFLESTQERIDLFARFKALSPFADFELLFEVPVDLAILCADVVRASGFSSKDDEFAFVLSKSSGGLYCRPIWIRPRPGSPGAEARIGPVVYT